jgi:hypothetical protein
MDCIISGPSARGREYELKKVTGDQSLCYVDDPVTKQRHVVGGGKKFTATQKLQFLKFPVWMVPTTYSSPSFPIVV